MRVLFTTALRAELLRERERQGTRPLALFILGLNDDGDLPAWELAAKLAPARLAASVPEPGGTLLVGAAPISELARTLRIAGESELSLALSSLTLGGSPVVIVHDVVRMVKMLHEVEAEEVEWLLGEKPAGTA